MGQMIAPLQSGTTGCQAVQTVRQAYGESTNDMWCGREGRKELKGSTSSADPKEQDNLRSWGANNPQAAADFTEESMGQAEPAVCEKRAKQASLQPHRALSKYPKAKQRRIATHFGAMHPPKSGMTPPTGLPSEKAPIVVPGAEGEAFPQW